MQYARYVKKKTKNITRGCVMRIIQELGDGKTVLVEDGRHRMSCPIDSLRPWVPMIGDRVVSRRGDERTLLDYRDGLWFTDNHDHLPANVDDFLKSGWGPKLGTARLRQYVGPPPKPAEKQDDSRWASI